MGFRAGIVYLLVSRQSGPLGVQPHMNFSLDNLNFGLCSLCLRQSGPAGVQPHKKDLFAQLLSFFVLHQSGLVVGVQPHKNLFLDNTGISLRLGPNYGYIGRVDCCFVQSQWLLDQTSLWEKVGSLSSSGSVH